MTATHPDVYDAELEPCWICHEPTAHGLCDRCTASPDPDITPPCPECGRPLRIGVSELTVGSTCDMCGYSDVSFTKYGEQVWNDDTD